MKITPHLEEAATGGGKAEWGRQSGGRRFVRPERERERVVHREAHRGHTLWALGLGPWLLLRARKTVGDWLSCAAKFALLCDELGPLQFDLHAAVHVKLRMTRAPRTRNQVCDVRDVCDAAARSTGRPNGIYQSPSRLACQPNGSGTGAKELSVAGARRGGARARVRPLKAVLCHGQGAVKRGAEVGNDNDRGNCPLGANVV